MPSISPEALATRLSGKGKPLPAILLLGKETYLRDAARQSVIDACVDPGVRDWALARFSAGEDALAHIVGHARMVPMLAPRQVVVVSDLDAIDELGDKARDAAVDELADYLKDPAPFTVLVLEAGSIDQRTKLYKLLMEKAAVVEAELPENPDQRLRAAATLATQMARDCEAAIEPDAAEELADVCNGDLALIRSEIAKLATYAGKGQKIQRAEVAELVASEKKYSVWELADMLAMRRRDQAMRFLDKLLREGEPPPALVGGMAWMFRKLIEAQDLSPHTNSYQAAAKLVMRPATAEIAMRQARKIPRRQLVSGLRALYDADSRLKSGADDRAVMEFLVARLTGGSEARSKS